MVDVFISYSHLDRSWVAGTLLPKLEAHSYITLIDYRDFRAGALSIDEMEKAVIGSRHTLLVLTPNYLASVWSKFENVMAQSLDPAAITRKVIPVLREDCDIPLRLQILHYRDLRVDDDDHFDKLILDLV
jgi:hypothetical protein